MTADPIPAPMVQVPASKVEALADDIGSIASGIETTVVAGARFGKLRDVQRQLRRLVDAATPAASVPAAEIRRLLDAEIQATKERWARSARGDVRCGCCGLRWDERQEYSCEPTGTQHCYDADDLTDAEQQATAEAVEHVTLEVAELRALIDGEGFTP